MIYEYLRLSTQKTGLPTRLVFITAPKFPKLKAECEAPSTKLYFAHSS